MVTILYAALLGLILVSLSAYVMAGRMKHKVMLGDGSNPDMQRRVRIHGNFAEYAPLGLLLLFLTEYAGYMPATVHTLGILLVVGRIAHAFGLKSSEGKSVGRAVGMLATLLMILGSSVLLLYKFYQAMTGMA